MGEYKTVSEVICRILHNWPNQYKSRLDCLNGIFCNHADWSKGYPIDHKGLLDDSYLTLETKEEDDIAAAIKEEERYAYCDSSRVNNAILRIKRDHARVRFQRENLAVIAEAVDTFSFSSYPRFTTSYLNSIPIDKLNDEWKSAFNEYCNEVAGFSDMQIERVMAKNYSYVQEYRDRIKSEIMTSVAAAKEGLIRLHPDKMPDNEYAARSQRIFALKLEAEKYGYTIIQMPS